MYFYNSVKIKNILKLLIKGNTEYQCQLSRGAELSCLYGAYGITGNTHHFCKLVLREPLLLAYFFEAVSEYK